MRSLFLVPLMTAALILTGCSAFIDSPFVRSISKEEVIKAVDEGDFIVEARLGNRKRYALGTRSEGYSYDVSVINVLCGPPAVEIPSPIYHYGLDYWIPEGHYFVILQSGPLRVAERITLCPDRRTRELREWISRAQPDSAPNDSPRGLLKKAHHD